VDASWAKEARVPFSNDQFNLLLALGGIDFSNTVPPLVVIVLGRLVQWTKVMLG